MRYAAILGPSIRPRRPPRGEGIALPRTTPSTAATSSTIDVTSKARRWSERKSSPICAGDPNDPVIWAVSLSSSPAFSAITMMTWSAMGGCRDDRGHVLEKPGLPPRARPPAR